MPTLFLSYRRSDTAGEAGRLQDSLRNKLGSRFAFRDVTNIPVGREFDAVLERELAATRVVLVLIGPAWLVELKERLTHSDIDYLRLEVATALKTGKRTVPVLLRGSALPPPAVLPEDLVPLTKRQAITIRDESWDEDVDRLIGAIGRPYRWGWLSVRAVAAVIVTILALWLLIPYLAPDRAADYNFLRRLLVWALVIYALIELTIGYLLQWRGKRQ